MKTILSALSIALCAGSAGAATVEFAFGGPTNTNEAALFYAAGDVSLTVTGLNCATFSGPNSASCEGATVDMFETGIGMGNGRFDSHLIDGKGSNEFVILSFDTSIIFEEVSFTYYSANDQFALYTWDGTEWGFEGIGDACLLLCGPNSTVHTFEFAEAFEGAMFAIGATGRNDDWKLAGVVVTYTPVPVPLPAAGGLLMIALGGIATLKRRQKAA